MLQSYRVFKVRFPVHPTELSMYLLISIVEHFHRGSFLGSPVNLKIKKDLCTYFKINIVSGNIFNIYGVNWNFSAGYVIKFLILVRLGSICNPSGSGATDYISRTIFKHVKKGKEKGVIFRLVFDN